MGGQDQIDLTEASTGMTELAGFLWGVGIFVAVIVGAIIGIKYMLGSVQEKAEHKNLLVPYVVGCTIIFGALTIWSVLINLLDGTV